MALGPFIYKVSKMVTQQWNVENDICYTSGLTAEQIGSWRGQFGDRPVTLLECDESRYDAHQGEGAFLNQYSCYLRCGINQYYQAGEAIQSMRSITGYSRKQLKYRVPYTMTSGSPTTSVGNTINNATTLKFAIDTTYPGLRYKMIVHGDDSLVVFEGLLSKELQEKLLEGIKDLKHRLGFKTKAKFTTAWYDVEYCSSLFWPCDNGSYVLGPKLGKRLPKLGFSINRLSPGEVKGMLIALKIECQHIPVIRLYAERNLRYLKDVNKVDYVDPRKIYKSLATTRHRVDRDTEYFFLMRYGVTVEEAEKAYEKCCGSTIKSMDNYGFIDLFSERDL
jgi:hypothetical protein